MDIRLPGAQALLIETVLNATADGVRGRGGVRVVLLLFNGGMVTIEELKNAPGLAIVECWCPPARHTHARTQIHTHTHTHTHAHTDSHTHTSTHAKAHKDAHASKPRRARRRSSS